MSYLVAKSRPGREGPGNLSSDTAGVSREMTDAAQSGSAPAADYQETLWRGQHQSSAQHHHHEVGKHETSACSPLLSVQPLSGVNENLTGLLPSSTSLPAFNPNSMASSRRDYRQMPAMMEPLTGLGIFGLTSNATQTATIYGSNQPGARRDLDSHIGQTSATARAQTRPISAAHFQLGTSRSTTDLSASPRLTATFHSLNGAIKHPAPHADQLAGLGTSRSTFSAFTPGTAQVRDMWSPEIAQDDGGTSSSVSDHDGGIVDAVAPFKLALIIAKEKPPVWEERKDANSFSLQRLVSQHVDESWPGAYDLLSAMNPGHYQLPWNSKVVCIKLKEPENIMLSLQNGKWASMQTVTERISKLWNGRTPGSDEKLVFLFSVSGSKQFCGAAEVQKFTPDAITDWWVGQSFYDGYFTLRWIFCKIVPFSIIRQIDRNHGGENVTQMWNGMHYADDMGREVMKKYIEYPHHDNLIARDARQHQKDALRKRDSPPAISPTSWTVKAARASSVEKATAPAPQWGPTPPWSAATPQCGTNSQFGSFPPYGGTSQNNSGTRYGGAHQRAQPGPQYGGTSQYGPAHHDVPRRGPMDGLHKSHPSGPQWGPVAGPMQPVASEIQHGSFPPFGEVSGSTDIAIHAPKFGPHERGIHGPGQHQPLPPHRENYRHSTNPTAAARATQPESGLTTQYEPTGLLQHDSTHAAQPAQTAVSRVSQPSRAVQTMQGMQVSAAQYKASSVHNNRTSPTPRGPHHRVSASEKAESHGGVPAAPLSSNFRRLRAGADGTFAPPPAFGKPTNTTGQPEVKRMLIPVPIHVMVHPDGTISPLAPANARMPGTAEMSPLMVATHPAMPSQTSDSQVNPGPSSMRDSAQAFPRAQVSSEHKFGAATTFYRDAHASVGPPKSQLQQSPEARFYDLPGLSSTSNPASRPKSSSPSGSSSSESAGQQRHNLAPRPPTTAIKPNPQAQINDKQYTREQLFAIGAKYRMTGRDFERYIKARDTIAQAQSERHEETQVESSYVHSQPDAALYEPAPRRSLAPTAQTPRSLLPLSSTPPGGPLGSSSVSSSSMHEIADYGHHAWVDRLLASPGHDDDDLTRAGGVVLNCREAH